MRRLFIVGRSGSGKSTPARIRGPGEARVTLNGEPRKAMADQIATASKVRLRDRIGALSAADVAALERAMRVQLWL